MEAIQQFVETEEEIVFGTKQAQAELKSGLGISHEDVVKQSRAFLEAAKARRAKLHGKGGDLGTEGTARSL